MMGSVSGSASEVLTVCFQVLNPISSANARRIADMGVYMVSIAKRQRRVFVLLAACPIGGSTD
jgi:hypothetical protein